MITEAIEACHVEVGAALQRPDAVGCRLRLTGRSDLRAALERSLNADDPRAVVDVFDW